MTENIEARAPEAENPVQAFKYQLPPRLVGTQEGKAIAHFMGVEEGSEAHLARLRDIEFAGECEHSGDTYGTNMKLGEHVAILDEAFRHYVSGGVARQPDDRNFILALKAQEQMLATLKGLRAAHRYDADRRFRESCEHGRDTRAFRREHRKSVERTGKWDEEMFQNILRD